MPRWSRTALRLSLVATCLLGSFASARADSLWLRRNPYFSHLFVDNRARTVGDVLTIVVRENTDIENRDERDQRKRTRMQGQFNLAGSMAGNQTSHQVATSLDTSGGSNKEFDSRAEYTSDRRFLDRMTVFVVGVLPNGTMAIEGYRKRVVHGETRTLMVRGVVWPPHIGPNNTVQSQYIANFEVYYLGKGSESRYINHGWLGKTFSGFWPF